LEFRRVLFRSSLKYLIATYGGAVGVEANWKSHDLATLWQAFMAMLEGYGHDDPNAVEDVVAEIVAEFSKVDPQSFSYRYPVDTKGRPLPIAHQELDLDTLADVMEAVEGY